MKQNRSTPIIALGLAVFVVGAALLFLLLRNDSKSSNASKPATRAGAAAATTSTTAAGGVTFSASPTTSVIQFKVPDGQRALSVQMDYFGGGGGFIRSGDTVDAYVLVNKDCKDLKTGLAVKLIEPNLKVLEAIGQGPAQAGQPTNFLLAVTPQQAERIIFLKTAFQLYFTLSGPNQPPATTTGVTCTNGI